MPEVICRTCGTRNIDPLPANGDLTPYACGFCGSHTLYRLQPAQSQPASAGAAPSVVGAAAGGAVGAMIAGPAGAVVGAVLGALLGATGPARPPGAR